MNDLVIKFNVSDSADVIKLDFFDNTKIEIDISGDIELTDFVKKLAQLIQNNQKLSLEKIELQDAKQQLIQKSIEDIINSFNETIVEEVVPPTAD